MIRLGATLVLAGAVLLAGCSGDDEPDKPASSPTASATPSPTVAADPPKPPRGRTCYRLD